MTLANCTLLTMLSCTLCVSAAETQNAITVKAGAPLLRYNPMIFGSFLEHFDNQVYGGVYDPKSKLSDKDGFRADVIKSLRRIRLPIVRWPGGCFVSAYHWRDGVGPVRESTYDKAWFVEEPNTFGTDEYVKWCRKVGCEPYICTNAGTGTPEEMSDWVEYCNQTVGKFARLRAANGHPEPYKIKYWSVGNENWGWHETGAKTATEWGPFVRESSKMMRAADIRTKLLAAATTNEKWTMPLLQNAGHLLDYVCIHSYAQVLAHHYNPLGYLDAMMKTDRAEGNIAKVRGILGKSHFGRGRIKIAYDEWNLRGWHHPWHGDFRRGMNVKARRLNDTAKTYTMADAIFAACQLNAFLRNADLVEIACFAPVVNTTGLVFVHEKGIVKRTTYHVFDLYVNALLPFVAPTEVTSGLLKHGQASTRVIDAAVTCNDSRTAYVIALVNKSPTDAERVNLNFAALGRKTPANVSVQILSGDSPNCYNDIGRENRVVPHTETWPVDAGCIVLPAHSVTLVRID